MRRVRLCLAVLVLTASLLWTGAAEAHASLIQSQPVAGATVPAAPDEVTLTFNEALDANFSMVRLLDSTDTVIVDGPGQLDAEALVLQLRLPDLPNGSYTAVWRVRSAVDGHVTEGNVPFGVGVPSAGSLIPPEGAPDPATLPPPWGESGLRWLNYLATMLAFGGVAFGLLVWRTTRKRRKARSASRLAWHSKQLLRQQQGQRLRPQGRVSQPLLPQVLPRPQRQ